MRRVESESRTSCVQSLVEVQTNTRHFIGGKNLTYLFKLHICPAHCSSQSIAKFWIRL